MGESTFLGTKKQASESVKANNDGAVRSVALAVGRMSKAVLAGKGKEQAEKKKLQLRVLKQKKRKLRS